ncbi:MAG: fibronectin type III domain-containing protein, partial [bacterium]
MTAKPLSSHARKTWVILFSVMLGTSLQLSCQKSASSSAGAGGGVGGTTTAEEEVELEVSGTIDPTDFVQAQDSVEIGGVNLTTAGKYAISAFYLSPLGKKVPVYQGTSDRERFSFKSKVPKRYLTIDVTRLSDGYRLGAFLPPALRNKLAKLRLNRASSIAAKMANIVADKAVAGDEAALKALATNSISVADTLVLAQSVARVITEQETQNKGSSIDLAALAAKLVEKSNEKIAALQGEGQSVAVVAEKISEKTYETVFSGDAEATSPGVLAYRTNHDLGTSTVAKRDVAYEAIKDLSGDSTKYVDAAFRVEAEAYRNASSLSDAVAAESGAAGAYSTKFSACYAGDSSCAAPAGYIPPPPPSSSAAGGNSGGTGGGNSGSDPVVVPAITINSHPSNQTAANGSATFSVSASVTQNAELTYQWQKKESGASSFVNLNAETSSSLSPSGLTNANDNGDVYRVIVSASGGATSVTSSAATLTVNPCPANGWCAEESTFYIGGAATSLNMTGGGTWNGQTYTSGSPKAVITITAHPANQTASDGGASFSVVASATNGASLTYQWQKQESGASSFVNMNAATSSTLSLSDLTNANDNGDVYQVIVSATGGATSVTSSTATLTVPDGDASAGVFTVSGLTGSKSGANGTYVLGGTLNGKPYYKKGNYGPHPTILPAVIGDYIIVWAPFGMNMWNWWHNESGVAVGSNTNPNDPPTIAGDWAGPEGNLVFTTTNPTTPVITINTHPANQTAASGSATFTVTASVTENATLSYQWQKQESSGSSFSDISGAISATLSRSSLTNANDNGDLYRVVVSATGGAVSLTSSQATLTVNPCPANGWCADESSYYIGGTATSLNMTGNGTWNGETYTSGSPKAVITITAHPANQTASDGGASFSVVASATNGASLTYQWQKQESGASSFVNMNAATSSTLSLSDLTNANDNGDVYRVIVSATGGADPVSSNTATLTVAAAAPTAPTSVAGTAGNAQVSLTWSAPSSNGGATITDYVIQYSSNNGNTWTTFSDGISTNTNALVTGLTNGTAYVFRVAAENSTGTGNYSVNSGSVTPTAPIVGPMFTNISAQAGYSYSGEGTSTLSFTFDTNAGSVYGGRILYFTVSGNSNAKLVIPQFGGNSYFTFRLEKIGGPVPFGWIEDTDAGEIIARPAIVPKYEFGLAASNTPDGNDIYALRSIFNVPPGNYFVRMDSLSGGVGTTGGINRNVVSIIMNLSNVGSMVWGAGGNILGRTTDTLVATGSTRTVSGSGSLPTSCYSGGFAIDTRWRSRSFIDPCRTDSDTSHSLPTGNKTLTFNRISGSQTSIVMNINGGPYAANGWTEEEDGSWTTTNLSSVSSISLLSNTTLINRIIAVGPTSGTGLEKLHALDLVLSSDGQTGLEIPSAPTNLIATAGPAQASLSWTAPTISGTAQIIDYVIQYSSNGGSSWATFPDDTSSSTNATVTGLLGGTSYVFRVTALTALANGSNSTPSSSIIPSTPVTSNLTSNGSSNSWRWASGGYTDSHLYIGRWDDGQIESAGWRSSFFGVPKPISISSATFTLPYTWSSALKATTSVVLRGAKLANASQGLQGTSPTIASATGTVTSSNGNLSIDCTAVIQEIVDQPSWQPGNPIVIYLSGENFPADSEISANDTAGTLTITIISAQSPEAPSSVAGTAGNTQVSLTWSAPSNNGGAAITDYLVQYSSNNGTDWNTFSDGTSSNTGTTVTGLTNGTNYTF